MFLDLSYNRIEVVDILPARRVQAGGPMWQTINLEIKGGSDHFHNNRAVAEGDNVSFYAIFCVCKSHGKTLFLTCLKISAQRVPEPDPLPGISIDTRPDPIQF